MPEYLPRENMTCDICGSAEHKLVCKAKSLYSDELFTLVRCRRCSLVFVNPRQEQNAKLANLTKTSSETSFEDMQQRDDEIYSVILNKIDLHCPNKGLLLDIGCASGGLLLNATRRGYMVAGVEINEHAVHCARETHGLNIRLGPLEEAKWPQASFDIITMINTIEHLYHPSQIVAEIYRILKPGGYFYCMTPDFNHYATRLVQLFGLMNDVDRIDPTGHPYHFTPSSLSKLIKQQGFNIIECGSPITGLFIKRRKLTKNWHQRLICCMVLPVIGLSKIFPIGSTIQLIAKKR